MRARGTWRLCVALVLALAADATQVGATGPGGERTQIGVQLGPVAESDIASAVGGFAAVRVPARRWCSLVGVGTLTHAHAFDRNDPPGDTLTTATVAAYVQFALVPRHTVSPFLRVGFGRLFGSQRRSSVYANERRIYWDEHRRGVYLAMGLGLDAEIRRRLDVTLFVDGGAGSVTKSGFYDIPGVEHRATSGDQDFFLLGHAALGVSWKLP